MNKQVGEMDDERNKFCGQLMSIPDETLVSAVKNGDSYGTEVLVNRYQNRLYTFLVRLTGNPQLAEEAVQETLIRSFKKIRSYSPTLGTYKSWLFTIGRNEAMRLMKKEQRQRAGTESFDNEQGWSLRQVDRTALSPGDTLVKAETRKKLEAAINMLPQAEREVVLLRFVEEMPFREIAKVTNTPLNTALGRMRNGQKRLKDYLARDGENYAM